MFQVSFSPAQLSIKGPRFPSNCLHLHSTKTASMGFGKLTIGFLIFSGLVASRPPPSRSLLEEGQESCSGDGPYCWWGQAQCYCNPTCNWRCQTCKSHEVAGRSNIGDTSLI